MFTNLPIILIIIMIVTLGFSFFSDLLFVEIIIWMDWIEFFGKMFLAVFVVTIQLLSVHTINLLITNLPGLSISKKVKRETLFVFIFFAIQALFDSGLSLALQTYSRDEVDFYTPSKAFLETVYCMMACLHLVSYVVFIIILQQYWAFAH